jgi:hypothetical protein
MTYVLKRTLQAQPCGRIVDMRLKWITEDLRIVTEELDVEKGRKRKIALSRRIRTRLVFGMLYRCFMST